MAVTAQKGLNKLMICVGSEQCRFFRTEYFLDNLVATMPQPHIALLDGITMGGGAGISINGTFRIATEK